MRHRSISATIGMMAREAARVDRARIQAQRRHEREQAWAARNAARRAINDAKEAARQYLAGRIEETEEATHAVQEREGEIARLLLTALATNPSIKWDQQLQHFKLGRFDEEKWTSDAPDPSAYAPKPLGFFGRLIPGATGRHTQLVAEANRHFEEANAAYQERLRAKDAAKAAFDISEAARKKVADDHNEGVQKLRELFSSGDHAAVVQCAKLIIDASLKGEPDAVSAEVGFAPDSRHLVVDLELPEFSSIPEQTGFRYIKASDKIEPINRPPAKRKTLYANLLCQVALKCIDTVFRGCPAGVVECLTLNGMLETVDPATGQRVRPCLLSVRVTADTFRSLNLTQVQPEYCLRSLNASVSRAPTELLPVKPLVELDMVDPRFVQTLDVMSGLDSRPNLMELTPTEFEGLITNLFASIGLDTRQTRASRDGGVDCVAFDTRPIFGGKVVIQAKRYKNTVGVSAVRDLFGTVVNEGASKGILVTTSGYGKAAFEFASGKPLELLDGGNLLHLLAEHAKMDARIVMPDDWVDPPVHGE